MSFFTLSKDERKQNGSDIWKEKKSDLWLYLWWFLYPNESQRDCDGSSGIERTEKRASGSVGCARWRRKDYTF